MPDEFACGDPLSSSGCGSVCSGDFVADAAAVGGCGGGVAALVVVVVVVVDGDSAAVADGAGFDGATD